MILDPAADLARLDRQLRLVHDRADDDHTPEGSAWSSRRHLQHTALVASYVATIVKSLLRGRGEEGGETSGAALAILASGRIPRGVGQAPEAAIPEPDPEPAAIRDLAAKARDRLAALARAADALAASPRRFPHHLLGPLTAAEWLRFLAVHTAHHLAILDTAGAR